MTRFTQRPGSLRKRGVAALLLGFIGVFPGCSAATTDAPGAAAPGLSFPARLPAPSPSTATDERPVESEDRSAAKPGEPGSADLPDPPALMLTRQWEYEFFYDQGDVSVTRVRPLLFEHPVATARRMGRYAVELWIGHELVDRVRFDFPGLAVEAPPSGPRRPIDEPPSLAAGAVVSRKILVPASPRATRAVLVDRATGERTQLPWPPDAPLDPIDPPPDREPDE
jgi:hypothetical protein